MEGNSQKGTLHCLHTHFTFDGGNLTTCSLDLECGYLTKTTISDALTITDETECLNYSNTQYFKFQHLQFFAPLKRRIAELPNGCPQGSAVHHSQTSFGLQRETFISKFAVDKLLQIKPMVKCMKMLIKLQNSLQLINNHPFGYLQNIVFWSGSEVTQYFFKNQLHSGVIEDEDMRQCCTD